MDLFSQAGIDIYDKSPIKLIPNTARLGLVYQGSKRQVAEPLLRKMHELKPKATMFFDLFGGGGAMSAYALACGYITTYNEYNPNVYNLFSYFATGKEVTEGMLKWCSRDEFYQIKTKPDKTIDDIVKLFIYSFGCSGDNYFCTDNKVYYKEAGHNFVINCDINGAKTFDERYNTNIFEYICNNIYPNLTIKERRAIFANVVLKCEGIKAGGISEYYKDWDYNQLKSISQRELVNLIKKLNPEVEFKKYASIKQTQLKELERLQQLELLQQLEQLERLEQLQQLQRLQQLELLQQLEQLEQLGSLVFLNLSYDEVALDKDAIIYCDIPYKNTKQYHHEFDHDKFYNWCRDKASEGYTIFVSEYNMPDDFKVVLEVERRELFSSKERTIHDKVTEKLFMMGG